MNTCTFSTLFALAALSPVAIADIIAPAPSITVQNGARSAKRGNCALLASNTVVGRFCGFRDMMTQDINQDKPVSSKMAVFEVVDNLDYRRYERYGDGNLRPGARFTVAMNRALPGQPSKVVSDIEKMSEGDEAVMKIDHIFLFEEPEGRFLRPCTRMAVRPKPVAPVADAQNNGLPANIVPLESLTNSPSNSEDSELQASSEMTQTIIENGKVSTIRVLRRYDPASQQVKTRMFINGEEVDPQTRKPLSSTTPNPAPAATPAPAPDAGKTDDTIVEKPNPQEAPKLKQEDSF